MLTREEARKGGLCKTCAAFLPEGRVKCGAFPLDSEFCPRGNPGKVGFGGPVSDKGGARVSGSRTVKQGKVEERQSFLNFK